MRWKGESEFGVFLRVLGFQEVARCPKMKDIVRMFRRTALKKHPDKPGGSTQEFQKLQEAFRKAGQYLEEVKTKKALEPEEEDVEESAARKLFKEFYLNGETYQSDFLQIFREADTLVELAAGLAPPPAGLAPPPAGLAPPPASAPTGTTRRLHV
jgi:DnaJ-class molecular chaperone